MNEQTLKGNWKETKGKVKQFWGKLTDDDLDRIDGIKDEFVGTVQKKYGYSKEEARSKINEFLDRMSSTPDTKK